jgi:3-oxoacyl-[acyl-carrier protein] reductase
MAVADDFHKTVVVTGGSSGIGRAIVIRMARDGYRVAFLGTSEERVRESLTAARAAPHARVMGRVCDLRSPEAITGFFNEVRAEFGDVGALINNAGISPKEDGVRIASHAVSRAAFEDVLKVNLLAPLSCTQQVLPAMMQRRFGRIVMIGSIAARALPRFAGSAYVSSKAGLAGLARSLASEYGRYNITTNVVSPGNVATGMTGDSSSPQNAASIERIPAGRIGLPDDFPSLIAYLCSEQSGFINGATIDVTGGEYVTP